MVTTQNINLIIAFFPTLIYQIVLFYLNSQKTHITTIQTKKIINGIIIYTLNIITSLTIYIILAKPTTFTIELITLLTFTTIINLTHTILDFQNKMSKALNNILSILLYIISTIILTII